MKILFACGGTAGHINPALAIADLLKRNVKDLSVVFVGTPDGMENRLVKEAGYEIRHVPARGFRSLLSPGNVGAVISLFRSFRTAGKIIAEEAPDLIVGTGGYVCYPVMRVAAAKGIPTVLHESNARAGKAARAIAKHTDLVLIRSRSAKRDLKSANRTVVSGNPLRREFYTLTRDAARRRLGLTESDLYLLVFGGSLGAAKLNQATESAVPRLLSAFPRLTILHASGLNKGDTRAVNSDGRYRRRAYIDDMATHLFASDAVVCRAGAMTLSEIAAAGVPSILVPYPAAAGDHQTKNAEEYVKYNAAVLLPDRDLSPDSLTEQVSELLSDPDKRVRMREAVARFRVPDCETIILREILSLCPRLEDYR